MGQLSCVLELGQWLYAVESFGQCHSCNNIALTHMTGVLCTSTKYSPKAEALKSCSGSPTVGSAHLLAAAAVTALHSHFMVQESKCSSSAAMQHELLRVRYQDDSAVQLLSFIQ